MGIAIDYQGSLDEPEKVSSFIADMQLRCQKLGWPCVEVNERIIGRAYYYLGSEEAESEQAGMSTMSVAMGEKQVEDRIRGVRIQPPETETFVLTFNRDGKLVDYFALPGKMVNKPGPGGYSFISYTREPGYYIEHDYRSVKTTGRVEAHVLIVALLQYIQARYMSNLVVQDDAGYWESGDLEKLFKEHALMTALIDSFAKPESAKALLKMAGLAADDDEDPVVHKNVLIRTRRHTHGKDWGISANEN